MKNFEARLKNIEMAFYSSDVNKVFVFETTSEPPTLSYNKKTIELKTKELEMLDEKSLEKLLVEKGMMRSGERKFCVLIKKI